MKAYALAIGLAVTSLVSNTASAQYAVIDNTNIAKTAEVLSQEGRQSGLLNQMDGNLAKVLLNLGQVRPGFINNQYHFSQLQRWMWYSPSFRSPSLANVQGIDWSSQQSSIASTERLFYTPNANPTNTEILTLKTRRGDAVREASHNLMILTQQHRQLIKDSEAEMTSLLNKANSPDFAGQMQTQTDILLSVFRLQVAANALQTASAQLQAMQIIAGDSQFTAPSVGGGQ